MTDNIKMILKLIIFTRFPAVVADLLETRYKRIVVADAANLVGEIEVGESWVAFPYAGGTTGDPIYTWITWARNCGLIGNYKLTKEG